MAAPLPKRWALWWIWMWGVIAALLLPLAFFVSFRQWSICAAVGFGVPELISIRKKDDSYPPLTQVIHRYSPRWLTFIGVWGISGAVYGAWFNAIDPWAWALAFAMLGWLTDHFTSTYDND